VRRCPHGASFLSPAPSFAAFQAEIAALVTAIASRPIRSQNDVSLRPTEIDRHRSAGWRIHV
jgi:hypothetical protein